MLRFSLCSEKKESKIRRPRVVYNHNSREKKFKFMMPYAFTIRHYTQSKGRKMCSCSWWMNWVNFPICQLANDECNFPSSVISTSSQLKMGSVRAKNIHSWTNAQRDRFNWSHALCVLAMGCCGILNLRELVRSHIESVVSRLVYSVTKNRFDWTVQQFYGCSFVIWFFRFVSDR